MGKTGNISCSGNLAPGSAASQNLARSSSLHTFHISTATEMPRTSTRLSGRSQKAVEVNVDEDKNAGELEQSEDEEHNTEQDSGDGESHALSGVPTTNSRGVSIAVS